jgi:hypothetical protein
MFTTLRFTDSYTVMFVRSSGVNCRPVSAGSAGVAARPQMALPAQTKAAAATEQRRLQEMAWQTGAPGDMVVSMGGKTTLATLRNRHGPWTDYRDPSRPLQP